MNTVINLSKVLTKMQDVKCGTSISSHKLNDLVSLVTELNMFELTGTISVDKLNKYNTKLENAGYTVSNVIYNEFMYENAVSFRFVYTKCI
jgi:hypothetical protein